MPLAREVSAELRKLADSLDANPDATIVQAFVSFNCKYEGESSKDKFLAIANGMPRPFKKDYGEHEMKLRYTNDAVDIWTTVMRSSVCRMVKPAQPAEFECEPILSDEEEANIGDGTV